MGKGDTYRPVDKKRWDNEYDRIFGVKKTKGGRLVQKKKSRG